MWAAHQLDIGVVARFGTSDVALVFRCETDAKGVAAAIHANCLRLANEIKLAKERQRPLGAQNGKKKTQPFIGGTRLDCIGWSSVDTH